MVFYGTERERSVRAMTNARVVVTTYGVVTSEHAKEDSPLFAVNFFRVVLDEAHLIKSRTTAVSRGECARVCVCRAE